MEPYTMMQRLRTTALATHMYGHVCLTMMAVSGVIALIKQQPHPAVGASQAAVGCMHHAYPRAATVLLCLYWHSSSTPLAHLQLLMLRLQTLHHA